MHNNLSAAARFGWCSTRKLVHMLCLCACICCNSHIHLFSSDGQSASVVMRACAAVQVLACIGETASAAQDALTGTLHGPQVQVAEQMCSCAQCHCKMLCCSQMISLQPALSRYGAASLVAMSLVHEWSMGASSHYVGCYLGFRVRKSRCVMQSSNWCFVSEGFLHPHLYEQAAYMVPAL